MANNLTAIITADNSKFVKEIQSAQDMLKKFVSATENASSTANKNTSATNEQVNAYKRVVKQLEKVASGNMSTTQQTKALEAQVRELKIQWANLSDEAKKGEFGKAISGSLSSASKQLDTLKTQLNQTSDATKKSSDSTTTYDGSLGSLIGVAKKLAPAIGGLVTVQKTFTEVINGSQTTSDAFNNTIYTGKNVLKEFASAIATFDFSAFNAGLDDIIRKGYEAATAIDQLGNTILSYNIVTAKANQKLAAARAIFYNPNSTAEEKSKAKKDMEDALGELKGAADVMMDDYETTLIAEVNARGGSLSGDGALALIDKWLEVDVTKGREAAKQWGKEGYDAYSAAIEQLNNDIENLPTITTFTAGGMFGGSVAVKTVDKNSKEYKQRLSELNDQYKDQVTYHVLLEKYSTEELEKLGQQRIAMINLNAQVDSYSATMDRLNKRAGGGSGGDNSSTALIGSVTQIKQAITQAEKLKDEQEVGTEEWWKQVRALEALNEELNKAQSYEKRLTTEVPQLVPITNPIVGQVEGPEMKLAGKSPFEQYQEQVRNFAEEYKKSMQTVSEYSQVLNGIGSLFNSLGSTMDENGQQWMQFAGTVVQSVARMLPQLMSLVIGNEAAAMAEGTASSAGLPFPANLVAIASIIAELVAVFASIPTFADGGIIGGNSSIGDYNIARVNSGEMILNGSEQKRLFNMLDGNAGMISSGSTGGQVEFKINGTELVGVINNVNKKRSKL